MEAQFLASHFTTPTYSQLYTTRKSNIRINQYDVSKMWIISFTLFVHIFRADAWKDINTITNCVIKVRKKKTIYNQTQNPEF